MRVTVKRSSSDRCWAIVLAGGEGARIRSLIEHCLGFHCPKQYVRFYGKRSMLEHTNSRAVELAGADRVITVVGRGHQRFLQDQKIQGQVVEQPVSRGTGAGVLLALAEVMVRDPEATVLVFPSDHFVYPRSKFLELVERARALPARLPDRLVLLTAIPDRPETDYGWVEPGPSLKVVTGHWEGARAIRSFHEKPSRAKAREFLGKGYLWNTMILAFKPGMVWSLASELLPRILGKFDDFRATLQVARGKPASRKTRRAILNLYATIPKFDFSRTLLARSSARSVLVPLDGVMWSDWGRAERIFETLRVIGKEPLFLASGGGA